MAKRHKVAGRAAWKPPAIRPDQAGVRQRDAAVRDALGRFVKGHSGNPLGRPVRVKEFVDLVRDLGAPAAFLTLLADLTCGHPPTRAKSAEILWAYGLGKPRVQIELTGKDGGPVEVNDARARLAALLERRLEAMEKPTSGKE